VKTRTELLAYRARLVERAASERAEVTGLIQPWEEPLAIVDSCVSFARALRESPWVAIGSNAAVVTLAAIRAPHGRKWIEGARAGWRLISRSSV
jgi:hypothetical protein